jgi:hypothetical protein
MAAKIVEAKKEGNLWVCDMMDLSTEVHFQAHMSEAHYALAKLRGELAEKIYKGLNVKDRELDLLIELAKAEYVDENK